MDNKSKRSISSSVVAGFWRAIKWGKTPQELHSFIQEIVDLGITRFDHARVYQSEKPFGEALSLSPGLRENVHIVTKFGIQVREERPSGQLLVKHYDSGREQIIASVEASLQDLQTDYIDTLLIHRPDYLMDVDEVSEAFTKLKAQGKVQSFGVSNFNFSQFSLLENSLDMPICTNQIEFSPFELSALDNGLFDQCYQSKARPMLWSCLGGGRFFDENDPITAKLIPVLKEIQEEVDASSVEQVLYAWILKLPSQPMIITGSSKVANIQPAVEALSINMTREQWYRILLAIRNVDVA